MTAVYNPPIGGGGGGAVNSVNGQTGTVVLTTNNIPDSTNFRYVTDAELAVLVNTSGINTGDQTIILGGDLSGTGTGSINTTLATVNSNVGSFTNANITVNAKGLITAASNGSGGSGATFYASTQWMGPPGFATGSLALSINTINFIFIPCFQGSVTITAVAVRITAATTGNFDLAIYSNSGNRPLTFGQSTGSQVISTGVKKVPLTATYATGSPGYWLAVNCDTAMTIQTQTNTVGSTLMPVADANTGDWFSGTSYTGFTMAQTFGTWPTAASLNKTGNGPYLLGQVA